MDDYRESPSDPGDWVSRGGHEVEYHGPPSSLESAAEAQAEGREAGGDASDDNSAGDGDMEDSVAADNSGDDEAADNGIGDDEAANDETSDHEAGDDGTADDGTGDGGTADDKTGDDETSDDETGDDGTADDGTGDGGTADDKTGDDETSDDETGDDGTADDETADDGLDAVVSGLRSRLDAVVDDSRLIAAAEASRFRNMYLMLQDALDNPGVFIPNADGITRKELTGDSEGWVRSSLAQEIGAALGITKGQAAGLLMDAEALCETLPETLDALEEGEITRQHTNAMLRQASGLNAEETAALEDVALPKAAAQSPTQFGRAVVKIREGLFPDTITERRREAVKARRTECYGTPDGMGALTVHAPIEVVQSLHNAARATARALKAAGDDRTLAQIEADALVDAIMIGFTQDAGQNPGVDAAGTGANRIGKIRPNVHVTVPVLTLLGTSEEPGHLDGYGPIAPDVARQLAAQAPSFIRLLTHPETGAVLSVGRDSYKVPADLKRSIQLRDETCTGIGCDRSATTCDLDHVREWQNGGETRLTNVASECEQHHMIRHHTTWQIRITDVGEVEWTSPLGLMYRVPRTSNVQFAETTDSEENSSGGGRVANTNEYGSAPSF
ncbi:HNH endonuclease signature motif containing protein [Microbacterium sp. MPKO10]|uniref:HNH endonuclease signature motif containing protein n=1 Tax=Microbacterium sp. MPKO10 TaxID=2989818 RepID=UPI0022356BFA|nr:DUF222 domain-containing protein [Microbacterium sp. MPKO10]MCW4457840.1 DUF222 domain-containing protein [Microbacterium sp. MPKO10]